MGATSVLLGSACGLLLLAWPQGTQPVGLLTALMETAPNRSLPLALALLWMTTCVWLVAVMAATRLAAGTTRAGGPARRLLPVLGPASVRRLAAVLVGTATLAGAGAPAALAGQQPRPAPTAAPGVAAVPATAAMIQQATQAPTLDRPAFTQATDPPVVSPLDRPASPAVPATTQPAEPAQSAQSAKPAHSARPAHAARPKPGHGLGLVSPLPTRQPLTTEQQTVVTVAPGDCLWRIAARSLPRGATSAAIARAWPRWYAANRAVIGVNPDLLIPGQRLVAPDA